jgi:hypothetical protein
MRTRIMSQEEYEELTDILTAAEELQDSLTPWEIEFVSSFGDRVSSYGQKTLISDKQWVVLRRIRGALK